MEEFVTPMAEAGIGMHEMFSGLVSAGFDANQALYLVGQYLKGMASPPAVGD